MRVHLFVLTMCLGAVPTVAGAADQPAGGALAGQRPRVIVSTDIGGGDPDDYQSMIHLLMYADVLDIEGLVSSPPLAGRKANILECLAAYELDYPRLQQATRGFPTAESLRRLVKQGAVDPRHRAAMLSPRRDHVGSWRAGSPDPRPLWILVWGSITDVAQAVHDQPGIKKQLRVYSIGSWNTRHDQSARDYLFDAHPDLWWIEADTTFRGMYMGGRQDGDLGNRTFVEQHVRDLGSLGRLYQAKKPDIKMGDTPSVLFLLRGNLDDPTQPSWGGAFLRDARHGPNYWRDDPDPALRHADRDGAQTVNRYREQYLRDWQARMQWLGASR